MKDEDAGAQSKLAASLERLFARHTFGMKLGLEVEHALLDELGNPHKFYPCVHVAGSNGKGSVCAMVESVLRASGANTALYTSPHLVRFNERFLVDGVEAGDGSLLPVVAEVEKASGAVAAKLGREPTFFECATAIAFELFRRGGVQIAVMETGMGGRLDATNVLEPLVAVITRIDIEHVQHLGGTLQKIAFEKGGIVKAGRPVVTGAMPDEARAEIIRIARGLRSPVVDAGEVTVTLKRRGIDGQVITVSTPGADYGTVRLPLLGPHQLENVATAVAAIETAGACLGREFEAGEVKRGLETVRWPGRCHVLAKDPVTLVDGAHNPGGAEVLASALPTIHKGPWGLVTGMCSDKDELGFARALAAEVKRAWVVPISNERDMPRERLLAAVRGAGVQAEESELRRALAEARAWARSCGGAVCIAGSLFLAGEVLALAESGEFEPHVG